MVLPGHGLILAERRNRREAERRDVVEDRRELTYTYDTKGEHTGITDLIHALRDAGIRFNDLQTKQSSLEEIFVDLVKRER